MILGAFGLLVTALEVAAAGWGHGGVLAVAFGAALSQVLGGYLEREEARDVQRTLPRPADAKRTTIR